MIKEEILKLLGGLMLHIDFIQTNDNELEEDIRKIFKNENVILDKEHYSVIYKNKSCNTLIIYGQTPKVLKAKLEAIKRYIDFKENPEPYLIEMDDLKEV